MASACGGVQLNLNYGEMTRIAKVCNNDDYVWIKIKVLKLKQRTDSERIWKQPEPNLTSSSTDKHTESSIVDFDEIWRECSFRKKYSMIDVERAKTTREVGSEEQIFRWKYLGNY